MHSGRLEARSDGVGHGATFTFQLDLAVSDNVSPEAVEKRRYSLDGLDVLIVEDSPDTLMLLSTIFRREGASVTTAESASEALTRAIDKRPHIIRVRHRDAEVGWLPTPRTTPHPARPQRRPQQLPFPAYASEEKTRTRPRKPANPTLSSQNPSTLTCFAITSQDLKATD
jgi:hypothetical protein